MITNLSTYVKLPDTMGNTGGTKFKNCKELKNSYIHPETYLTKLENSILHNVKYFAALRLFSLANARFYLFLILSRFLFCFSFRLFIR